ncbi:DUF559 domain-containing protein [Kytococcus sedentarius]|uniref:DUF559 domain-containing protein n=1 Tax=Kytococcus sedentarius TaxID=1276 RepID=UPI0035BC51BA
MPTPSAPSMREPVHVRRPGRLRVRRPDVIAHSGLEWRTVTEVNGIRVTSPVDTWLDLAAPGHWGLDALVAAGDYLVSEWGANGPMEQFAEVLERRPGSPGQALARKALRLVRPRSRSVRESKARILMIGHGLPEPLLNHPVRNEHGQKVTEVDFAWEGTMVVVEYDGESHYESPEERRKTLRRLEMLRDMGYDVLTLTSVDLQPSYQHAWLTDLERRLGRA